MILLYLSQSDIIVFKLLLESLSPGLQNRFNINLALGHRKAAILIVQVLLINREHLLLHLYLMNLRVNTADHAHLRHVNRKWRQNITHLKCILEQIYPFLEEILRVNHRLKFLHFALLKSECFAETVSVEQTYGLAQVVGDQARIENVNEFKRGSPLGLVDQRCLQLVGCQVRCGGEATDHLELMH